MRTDQTTITHAVNIVTEEPYAATIVRRVLVAHGIVPKRILAASSPPSTASSFSDELPVAVVMSADSTIERAVSNTRAWNQTLLYAPFGKLFLAVPQVEAVLFHSPHLVERMLGVRLSDDDAIRAEYEPRRIYERLGGTVKDIETLPDIDAMRLGHHPLMNDLIAYVSEGKI